MDALTFLEPVVRAAAKANPARPGDYTVDGLLYCGKCHTRKQTRLKAFDGRVVSCQCRCAREAYQAEAEARKRQEEADRLSRLRAVGIANQRFRNAAFDRDDGKNPKPMALLRRYADKWPEMREKNIGLLLYGAPGTGKSYGAACVANALLEGLTPVLMTNLAAVLNGVSGLSSEERNGYVADLTRYPLLILDDFGMERNTGFALEQVYNVIDARYRSGKPLIVTTNLTVAQLHSPQDIDHARIYDRVLEMCVPINFGGSGRRAMYAKQKLRDTSALLGAD